MSSKEMRKLIESVEAAQKDLFEGQEYVKKFIAQFDKNEPEEAKTIEMIKKAYSMSNASPEKAADALYDLTSDAMPDGGTKYGDTDLSDGLKNAMKMDRLLLLNPEAARYIKKEYERAGGNFADMNLNKAFPGKDLDYVQGQIN